MRRLALGAFSHWLWGKIYLRDLAWHGFWMFLTIQIHSNIFKHDSILIWNMNKYDNIWYVFFFRFPLKPSLGRMPEIHASTYHIISQSAVEDLGDGSASHASPLPTAESSWHFQGLPGCRGWDLDNQRNPKEICKLRTMHASLGTFKSSTKQLDHLNPNMSKGILTYLDISWHAFRYKTIKLDQVGLLSLPRDVLPLWSLARRRDGSKSFLVERDEAGNIRFRMP